METLAKEIESEWNVEISLLEFGAFKTGGIRSAVLTHPYPSYTSPNLPTNIMRQLLKGFSISGDPEKGIDFVYEYFTTTPRPPRLPIGLDAIKDVRKGWEEVVTKGMNLTVDD